MEKPAPPMPLLPPILPADATPDLITRSASLDNFPPPPKELLKQFLNGPHTCPADQALIGVEVINRKKSGVTEKRRFNGLLLRCDGFLLVPLRLVSQGMLGDQEADQQTIRVTLRPGTPEARQAEAFLNRFTSKYVELAVLRLKQTHAPAARPLLPNTLKAGDTVEVVWADWEDRSGRFGAVQRRTVQLADLPANAEDVKAHDIWKGEIRFTSKLDDVPGGAVVIGPEGMALGILPGAPARHDRFLCFSVLDEVTGCVTAVPTTDAEFVRLQHKSAMAAESGADLQAAAPADASAAIAPAAESDAGHSASGSKRPLNDMVTIPGGPVKLPLSVLTDYHEMMRDIVACVPEFKMDRYKVSNREYFVFWNSLSEKQRQKPEVRATLWPISWATDGPPFPPEIEDTPVLGVPLAGAQAYALSQGKRLPTAYEWSRAAFGPLGDRATPEWAVRYLQDRQLTWKRLVMSHVEHIYPVIAAQEREIAAANLDNQFRDRRRLPINPVWPALSRAFTVPLITYDNRYADLCSWSKEQVETEINRLCKEWVDPLYVVPGGSRPFDVSPYGVRDMLLNGNERVAGYAEMGTMQEFMAPVFIQGVPDPHILDELGETTAQQWFTRLPVLGPGRLHREFKVDTDELWEVPLLSRRLVASSSRVRGLTNAYSPAWYEKYVELCERLFEAIQMIRPVYDLRIATMSSDAAESANWGDGTSTHTGQHGLTGTWGSTSQWPYGTGDPLPKIFGGWWPREARTGTVKPRFRVPFTRSETARPDEMFAVWDGGYFYESPFYGAWAGLSSHMRREIGRDWATDPPVHVGVTAQTMSTVMQPPDIYLIPNGFRCAR